MLTIIFRIELQCLQPQYETVKFTRRRYMECKENQLLPTFGPSPKNSQGRVVHSDANVEFPTEALANNFIKKICPFLPTSYTYIRVVKMVTENEKKPTKYIGLTLHVNSQR